MAYYYDFPTSKPKKVEGGIKAKSKKGKIAESWWADRWIKAMEGLMDSGRLARGKRYARAGQVISLTEKGSKVIAKVQGSRATPYKVIIEMTPLDDEEWEKVLDALAKQAIFAAQLLAGEMPTRIEEIFVQVGVSLFPLEDELTSDCSCPDWSDVCKHTAASHYLLAEQFDEDPFLLMRLRGRSAEQIMAALRERHSQDGFKEEVVEKTEPLSAALDSFWGESSGVGKLHFSIKEPAVPMSTLRRLGKADFVDVDLAELLKPVYQRVTEKALETSFSVAGLEDVSES